MEIEEKSPATAPEEGKTLNNGRKEEVSSNSETWSSSVKDSKWATAEPTTDENPIKRSNGSSSQSRWAATEGSRYRPQHNDKSYGGHSHTDRNRKEHSVHSRPYNNRPGYGGSPDGSNESFRPGNNHFFVNRSNNNIDNSRYTGNASMRFDSNTNQNYQNRLHNNTFREPDNARRSNSRYDDRNHNNLNDWDYGHQTHQHEGFERQNIRANYQSDRNNQHHGRQNPNDAISKWHSGNLVEEEPRSSAHERSWNMRFVTGDQHIATKSDDGNDGKNGYEEKKSAENKAEFETLAGTMQPAQESNKSDENRENVDTESHHEKLQTDTDNSQQISSSPKTTEVPGTVVVGAVEMIKSKSSLGSIHAVSEEALHDDSQSDVTQSNGDAITAAESVSKDSTASKHSADPKKAAEKAGHVIDWKKHATENNGALGFSSDSIHAHQERKQAKSTERKQSGASASAGKTSIINRLATGGYHKPTVDEDALNAKIERIRQQNEKIERKQKLIEQEELEIAQQMKLENEKLEQERRENEEFEKERKLAEEQKQREKQEKEKRILDQIRCVSVHHVSYSMVGTLLTDRYRAERDANASRKAEAMGNRDWDMSKGENDGGYRDRHSRSRFSNDSGKRWPSPPPRSRHDHGYDHGSGHHSQGYRRHDVHNAHQEPVKKQFSVTEQDWPDLGKGESASAERKPVVWAARATVQAKGQNTTSDAGKSPSSSSSNSQSTSDPHKLASWPSKKGQGRTEMTSTHDAADAKPAPPKLNWEDLISKTTPVKDWASDSPNNDELDFGNSPFG
ncbi:hypothetical protein INT43_007509 [Umbelopsis isabellina]|uniref:Uncharacterized protein n=1 Tax=Mortierella isabellina TaxID=91625 RepID=A0A8H7PZE2_MORIS|nr:hypothetical protein INT43_007509 [Umbelopsis isabellina]